MGHRFTAGSITLLALALAAPRATAAGPPLGIVILEGDGALNDIASERAHPPLLRIVDDTGHPVAGAAVTFALPEMGAGGFFDGGRLSLEVASDAHGIAAGRDLRPNNIAGPFLIEVVASHLGRIARAVVHQTNVATRRAESRHKGLYTALAVGAAAGATLAIVLATRGAMLAPAMPPLMLPAAAPTVAILTPWDLTEICEIPCMH